MLYDRDQTKFYLNQTRQSQLSASGVARLQNSTTSTLHSKNRLGHHAAGSLLNSGNDFATTTSPYERSGQLRMSQLQSKLNEVTSFNKKQRFRTTTTGGASNSNHRKSESINTLGTSFNRGASTRQTEQWAGQNSYQSGMMHHHSAKPSILHNGGTTDFTNTNNYNASSYSTTITAPRTVEQIKRRLMMGRDGSLSNQNGQIQKVSSTNYRNASSFQEQQSQQIRMSQDYRDTNHLKREASLKEFKSERSSPERLVNIVTPSQMTESKKSRSRAGNKTLVGSFSSSYHRSSHPGSRQMTTKNQSGGHLLGSRLQSQPNMIENSNYGRVQRLNSFKLVTPLKKQRSANSRSQSASKSRSRTRISSIQRSASGLQRKLQLGGARMSGGQLIVKRNEAIRMPKRLYRRKTISQSSHKKKSNKSLSEYSKSAKSPLKSHRSASSMSARKLRSSAKKQAQKIEINYRTSIASPPKQLKVNTDGFITGKFRSFQNSTELVQQNEKKSSKKQSPTNLHTLIHGNFSKKPQYLQTEDDLLDTQTCSSEDSPLRADTRVQRAAELTAKRYLEDIKQRVDVCNRDTQLMYDPLDMRNAARQIHYRQTDRLAKLKMEMQASLRQTQNLKGCLERSSVRYCDDFGTTRGKENRRQEVSPFNRLVLGFSEKMKQYATNLVEHSEMKRRRDQETLRASYRANAVGFRSPSTPKKRSLSGKKFKSQSPGKKSQRSSSKKKSKKSNKKGSKRSVSAPKSRSKSRKSRVSSRLSSAKSVKSNKSCSVKKSTTRKRSTTKKNSVLKTVKRDIFKSTNGYSNLGANSSISLKQAYVPIRASKSTLRSKQTSAMKSLSKPRVTRTQEIARKCNRLSAQRFRADLLPPQKKLIRSTSRSKTPLRVKSNHSKKAKKSKSVSRSRSKSIPRKRSKTPTKTTKATKELQPAYMTNQVMHTPAAMGTIVTQQMTPIHKILRNTITTAGEPTQNPRYGSSVVNTARKRVQICSRRLRDITALTSSSESSLSSNYEESLERKQRDLSPWQKVCIKKQLPQFMR